MTEKRLRSFGIWLLMTYGAWKSLLLLQWLAFCLIQTKRRALVLLSGEFFQTNEAQFICSCCFLLQYSHLIFLLRGKHRPKHSTVDIRWYLNHFHLPISHDIWTCPLTILCNLGHLDRYCNVGLFETLILKREPTKEYLLANTIHGYSYKKDKELHKKLENNKLCK